MHLLSITKIDVKNNCHNIICSTDKTNYFCSLFSLILDNERWKQADVPTEFQDLVNHILLTGK